ncbi:MAG TPA: exodeoxyribonuclease VII large subunit [Planctomycetota bacterium]|jgi:exodeoxyribonuclease VII large subunit
MPRRGLHDSDLFDSLPPEEPERRTEASKAAGHVRPATPARPKPYTITQITRLIKERIEGSFGCVWVEGEISNYRVYGSGHCYFTLKDEGAQLSAVLWRTEAQLLRFTPTDGTKVLAFGRLSVYEPRGQYQMVVEKLEPLGIGALAAAFEQLKAKLAGEGLFSEERKRPIPLYPRRIGIVTSPTGAAIRDMLKVIHHRWPVEIVLAGVRVQGDGAAAEISHAIGAFNRLADLNKPDVLIIGRGGGSLEDLWAFNEEVVARAIAASRIPIISAVGHEVDFTISDFVADVRAATPSHAGEIVAPRMTEVLGRLDNLRAQLPAALLQRVELARQRLNGLEQSYALRHPEDRIAGLRQRLDDLLSRMTPAASRRLENARHALARATGRLESLSPLKVLERGYSVTLRERDGAVVRSVGDVAAGEVIKTRVGDGVIRSKAEGGR